MRHFLIATLFALNASAETIKVSAGIVPLENIFRKIEAPFKKSTGIDLILTKATHVSSLEDLQNGKTDVASVGFAFEDWIARAQKDGLKLKNKEQFKFRVIGHDNVKFIAEKSNAISSLSFDQLKNIFTGKFKNWNELGGPDQKIIVIISEKFPGLNGLIKEKVLEGSDFLANLQKITGEADEIKSLVAKTKGSISFLPAGSVDNKVVTFKTPELGRPITAVTNGVPSPAVMKLFNFISSDGAKIIGD